MEYVSVSVVIIISVLLSQCSAGNIRRLRWVVDDNGCRTPSLGIGDCIGLHQCEPMLNLIESNDLNDDTSTKLRTYVCGIDSRGSVKVCCPREAGELRVIFNRAGTDPETHPNRKLLPTVCGVSNALRITNGNRTDLFEFPWAAVLRYQTDVNPWNCGGSVINNRYILTAAHCIRSRNKLLSVRLGEYDLRNKTDCVAYEEPVCAPPVQDFEVSENDFIVHPQYDSNNNANDIALIRLRRPADLTVDSVDAVCLPVTKRQRNKNFQEYTIIGWGTTETEFPSSVLLKTKIPKDENSKCVSLYSGVSGRERSIICAGGKNQQDACKGDSGGPLLADNSYPETNQQEWIQYGIVSRGPSVCGREGFPALYTNVESYIGWILDNIKP